MKNATTWIENNPSTGEIKPWEVWFQAERSEAHRIAICMTKEAANKSQVKMIKRNKEFYNVVVR